MKWSAVDVEEVPPAAATVTSTVPPAAAPAGIVATIDVLELNWIAGDWVVPKSTVVCVLVKPLPVIVTVEPPPSGPAFGLTLVTVGVIAYMNLSAAEVDDVPAGVVTMMSTGPTVAVAGEVAVIEVLELTVADAAAAPPKATVEPLVKLVPLIVTDVPPATGPPITLMPVTVGRP